jgi:hypothetical protein
MNSHVKMRLAGWCQEKAELKKGWSETQNNSSGLHLSELKLQHQESRDIRLLIHIDLFIKD